ncbi:mitoferrin-like protein [Blastocystis sp. subtype 4]|uniref:mitoferrin-like protein n=1 Tax=Blastocystis sp. subtype 4 TaxID=944170 RepID=UPI000711380C|nr:mitoferrin-like protein [Blastocystis sp. subtype 4]KNB42661.1 mitoferrin-like protein [Blastocystis sp. subtype 4]|eukprot:XP_014526104.1 mitoferrin-like protein [Blastocystis sp. subtype 4]
MEDKYDWEEWDPSSLSFRQHMVAGCVAGVSEHIVFFPIDTLRVMAIGFDFQRAVHRHGYRILWRGISTTIVACIPAHALYFSIYEYIKMRFGGIGGALASMAHDAVMTPLDVLKQRMQLGLYARPIDALREVVRTEGVKALYSSYFTTILMNVPNAAVLVVTNDWMKSILNPSGNQNFSAFLVSGLVAGALSGFVTCPLDVIKTRIQTQNGSGITTNDVAIRKYTGFWQTLKLMVKEEGIRSLFMGVSTRIAQQAPAAALSWTFLYLF